MGSDKQQPPKVRAISKRSNFPSSTESLKRSMAEQKSECEKHHSQVLDIDKDFKSALERYRRENESSKTRLKALKLSVKDLKKGKK